MAASRFAIQFAAKAAKVNAEEPSTSKWNGVRDLFGEDLGFDPEEIYVATISKPGNVSVRFGQSQAARSADLLIAMHTGRPSQLEGTIEALRRVAADGERVGVVAARDPGGWAVVAVIGPPGDAAAVAIGTSNPRAVLLPL